MALKLLFREEELKLKRYTYEKVVWKPIPDDVWEAVEASLNPVPADTPKTETETADAPEPKSDGEA